MAATADVQRRALLRAGLYVIPLLASARVLAHPMPDTEIVVGRDATTVALDIRLPFHDLLLASPPGLPRDARTLLAGNQPSLRSYFAAHTRLLGPADRPVPVTIGTIRLHQDHGADVGAYAELEVRAVARVDAHVRIRLAYDAILHRIANHRALVRDHRGRPIGTIRYSLASRRASPLALPNGPSS